MNPGPEKRPLGTRWCKTGITLAVIAAVLTLAGIGGGRTGTLSGLAAFFAFGLGALLFAVAIVANLVGLAISKGTAGDASARNAVISLVAGVAVIGAAMSQRPDSAAAPAIHDLTTDLADPPEFVAILPRRADAPNPPEYLDDGTAEQQRAAFPDLVTLSIGLPVDEVFAAAEQVVGELDWELVASEPGDGRIEATDTTYWFGFKDDVVIRVRGNANGTAVDVRSKSRVGRGDMGANAARIRAFLDSLSGKTGA
ncbi:MAG: DUF1499 domain-containing protein [Gammaproteobacteria bacterium]